MVVIIFFFFLITVPHATPACFNYTSFDSDNHEIRLEGYAAFIESDIQLTPNQANTAGYAAYVEPMHLWDKDSGSLADFNTHFTFSINALNNETHADGIAFFIADPLSFRMIGGGGGMGLVIGNQKFNSSDTPFVAVEFDTHHNTWDPENDHVGIDINSLFSIKTETWYSSPMDGKLMDARITYNSTWRNMSVVYTGIIDNATLQQELYYEIDLRDHMPEWVIVGFSAGTGEVSEFHTIHSWYFSSNFQIDKTNSSSPSRFVIWPTIVGSISGFVVGVCLAAVMAIFAVLYILKKRSLTTHLIAYSELVGATNNFAQDRKLFEGTYGEVYQGSLNGEDIAVKRLKTRYEEGKKEYEAEVKAISKLHHTNLVKLIGWCNENGQHLLVYELIPNDTLHSHLFTEERLLQWEDRYRICKKIASAIHYLHEGCSPFVLHRDIKSSNILLDSNLETKLGDFGLARLVYPPKGSKTTRPAGTFGYMDLDQCITGKATKESDVYSFGVLALVIASRIKPREVDIVKWVWELYSNRNHLEAADSRLQQNFNEQEMERLMIVGLLCAHPNPASRPSIGQALAFLNFYARPNMQPLQSPLPRMDMNSSNEQSSNFATCTSESSIPEGTLNDMILTTC